MAGKRYDAVVIGSGQGGNPLASALANAGKRVALIEQAHIGGTCVNDGCTPTKTMVASARVAYLARRAADYGVHTGPVTVDMPVVRQRKRDIVESWRNSSQQRLESNPNIDIVWGQARFTGPKRLAVGEREIEGELILINAGCRPNAPDIAGAASVRLLDSTSIMELDTVPEHLIVVGGGYIGLEFGQMFRRFGARVTIVQRGKQLLSNEDADLAEAVAGILREDGLDVLLETTPVRVGGAAARIELALKHNSGERTIGGSHLLLGTGRVPNSDTLNLAAAGVETDERGFIKVNERLETNVAGVYALGDIKGGPAFTHISYDDFRILRTNLLEHGQASTTDRPVPYTVFIDPQLGRVGLSEMEARRRGLNIRVASMPMSSVARALEMAEPRGLIKAVVDAGSDLILGAAVLGIEGGEVMAILQTAMMGGLPYTVLRDGIFAHPTLAEALNNLFGNFRD